jgi:hypothetical protein
MKINEVKGFFETRVNLGKFFGANDEDAYIILREPEEKELFDRMTNDASKNIEAMKKMWRDCVIGHNFENEDGTEMSNKEVFDVLSKKGWAVMHIITEWNKNIPLAIEKDSD